ncbi:cation:proton antiporter [Alicyclobacillus dauci]|uniref:Sodium:proton antiporter n=1 Tax=Alicyclobacillus dauci TaxID=1475485 RepID=A0ABY6Z809_9BACL|nr:sodium:proton antiporter [Alicyclobacillus dauci]WAH38306.1 sodium:proton antiporter [Alicyclobacillus dauci]
MLQMDNWEHALTVLIVVIAGGLVVGKLTEKPRIPDVAAYLVYGIVIGPAVFHLVQEPSQSQVNQLLLNMGATLILFDGGRSVRFSVLRRVWVSIVMLATIGVLVTAFVMCIAAHYILGTSWILSLLLGSVSASTDPATLIPVFKRVSIVPRLQQTVESESAFNDATGAVLVFTVLGLAAAGGHVRWYEPIWTFAESAVIGLVIGAALGLLSLWLVSNRAWGIFHEYGSIVMLAIALSSYQIASGLGASGFMAAFTAGVVSGNGKAVGWSFAAHTEENIHHFGNSITLIMRMLIFVLLGTQVDFGLVSKYLWVGLTLVLIFIVIARPLAVVSSVWADPRAKWRRNHITFMCWVRETGVIPAALSGMLVAKGIPGAHVISAITFLAILLTIVIQASTTGFVAKQLGVLDGTEQEDY